MFRVILAALATASLAACAVSGGDSTQMAKESHACAELGLAPGDAGYARCIGNLDMTMHDDYHPGASS